MSIVLALATLAAHAIEEPILLPREEDYPVPNYVTTMLPPKENSNIIPRLVRARRSTPIRVGIVPRTGWMTDERTAIVRAACQQWAIAAGPVLPGLRFEYVPYRRAGDAEIVFGLRGMVAGSTLKGSTSEHGRYATILLAVEDAAGASLPARDVLRVATHEVGHALGIWGHSPDPHDAMSLDGAAHEITLADVNTLRIAYGAY